MQKFIAISLCALVVCIAMLIPYNETEARGDHRQEHQELKIKLDRMQKKISLLEAGLNSQTTRLQEIIGKKTEELTQMINSRLPVGVIVQWSGTIEQIPQGWQLCNGQYGTPDLRDRFVVGAGKSYNVGTTGGEAMHRLTTDELPAHSHSFSKYIKISTGANIFIYFSFPLVLQSKDGDKNHRW